MNTVPIDTEKLTPAAVLIPLLLGTPESGTQAEPRPFRFRSTQGEFLLPAKTEVLLTLRTDKVEHHKGQISFPGGVKEPGDASLRETALRECWEEIGVPVSQVEIIAELADVPTFVSGFHVRPFVGLVRGKPEFQPNPHETAEILLVPLAHLLDPTNMVLETLEHNGVGFKAKAYHYGSYRIWGATARMLSDFMQKISTREETLK